MRRILLPILGICLLLAVLVAGHWYSARGFQRQLQAELEQNPLLDLVAYEPGLIHSDFTLEGMGLRLAGRAAHGPVLWRQRGIGATHVVLRLADDQPDGGLLREALQQIPQLRELRAEALVAYDGGFRFTGSIPAIDTRIAGEAPLALQFTGLNVEGEGRPDATGMTVTLDSASAGGSLEDGEARISVGPFSDHTILTYRQAAGPLLLLPPDRLEQQGRLELLRITPLAPAGHQPPVELSLHDTELALLATFDGEDRFTEQVRVRAHELHFNGQPVGSLGYQLELAGLDGPALRRTLRRLAQPAAAAQAQPPTEAELFGLLTDLLRHEARLQLTVEVPLYDFGDNRWQFGAHLAGPGSGDTPLLSRLSAETRLQLADPAALALTQLYLADAAAKGEKPPTATAVLAGLSGELGVLVRQANGYLLQVGVDFGAGTLTLGNGQSLPLTTLLPGMALLFGGGEE